MRSAPWTTPTLCPDRRAETLKAGREMVGVGCLLPLILLIAGALVGHELGGPDAVPWGALLGFAAGALALACVAWLVAQMKHR